MPSRLDFGLPLPTLSCTLKDVRDEVIDPPEETPESSVAPDDPVDECFIRGGFEACPGSSVSTERSEVLEID